MLVKFVDHYLQVKCWALLDSAVDVLQHVLVKVLVSVHSFQIFLELLYEREFSGFKVCVAGRATTIDNLPQLVIN